MSRMTTALRGFVVTTSIGLGLLAASGPATAAAIVTQPFAADSGDACGTTSGTFGWHLGGSVGSTSVVDVSGTLVDRPLLADPANICRDDRYAIVTFTAYSEKTVVDTDARKADNERAAFGFQLTADLRTPIDRVVVQVCRRSLSGTVADYCGKAAEYTIP